MLVERVTRDLGLQKVDGHGPGAKWDARLEETLHMITEEVGT
jgi:hypothetical protein